MVRISNDEIRARKPSVQELKPDQVLADRFVLSERCSRPGFGESWRARDRQSGAEVLIKVVAAVATDSRAVGARQKALAALSHPALACSVELLWNDGYQLQIRPWITGSNSLALDPGNLDVVFKIAIRIAEGLHHAHQQGVCHGNLSPGNVLLDPGGRFYLVDAQLGPVGTAGCMADNDYASPESKAGSAIEICTDIYSIGALFYCWLSGRSPGRPLPERQRQEDLRRATSAGEAPPGALISLVADCLSPDPERRPATILEVKERLEDARLALIRARETGMVDPGPGWQPEQQAPRLEISTDSEPNHRRVSPGRLMLGVAAGVVAILLLTVLIVLPRQMEQAREARRAAAALIAEQRAAQKAKETARAALLAAPRELTTAELERLLAAKKAAEETLDAFINLQLELQEKKVEHWAQERFAAAGLLAKSGEEPFRNQVFEKAGAIYQQALEELRQLEALGEIVFAEAVERGLKALDTGDSADAIDAFELALALNPESQPALKGQKRAATLDQVWALWKQARELDRAEAWAQAQIVYRQIQALDPETAGIEIALKRIANTLADIGFRDAMSAGLLALDQSQWDAARAAFGEARKRRPGARGPVDGLLEVERRFRESEIRFHRIQALASQAAEQWADALRHFEAVLSQDPNLLFALDGKRSAADRLDLDARLEQFVNSPERWWTDRGRQQATSLLYDARSVENPGPRLATQIEQLGRLLVLAERPIKVRLVSDSSCDVVVYKIGRLGSFESREVNLRPGRYTAVGTRNGYRDVRREFMVRAESAPQPVVVRCDEKV